MATEIQRSMARLQSSMDLDGQFRNAMMTCVSGRGGPDLIATFRRLRDGYKELLDDSQPSEQLLTADMLKEKLADVADWCARALETNGDYDEAVAEFKQAAAGYQELGKSDAAQCSLDKAGEIDVELHADIDAELQRLLGRLEESAGGSLDRVQVLVSLGELHSKANDDFEAVKYLEQAEQELDAAGGHPSDDDLLGDLARTIQSIDAGKDLAGKFPVEMALKRRALTQRLNLALGNVYRTTDPERAAIYEQKLRSLDEGRHGNIRQLMGDYLDADGDIAKMFEKKSERRR